VVSGLNVLVAGGTQAGKTTLNDCSAWKGRGGEVSKVGEPLTSRQVRADEDSPASP
jgi:hypothetical protein